MSSILTNTGAMVALQSLKSINKGLGETQAQISTGKKVATAKDNAAVWAISKVMEADVAGFKKIGENLSVAESTVAVARDASETVTDLLKQVKTKIIQSQDSSQDQGKIQADITALTEQVTSVVGAAQFNGVNMVTDAGSTDVLSSLNRDTAGNVTSSEITVNHKDLSIGGYTAAAALGTGTDGVGTAGDRAAFAMDASTGTGTLQFDTSVMGVGDSLSLTIGDKSLSVSYTQANADATDPNASFANAVKSAIDSLGIEDAAGNRLTVDYDPATAADSIVLTNGTANDLSVSVQYVNEGAGALGALSAINVDDTAGGNSKSALAQIDGLIEIAVDAAAAFGTSQNQISTQNEFVSKLTDSVKAGIGSLVDADMEEVSARLQALQTQQQLGIQSLSIANQAPQSILSLFR